MLPSTHKVIADTAVSIAAPLAVLPWLDQLDLVVRILAALAAIAASFYSIYIKHTARKQTERIVAP